MTARDLIPLLDAQVHCGGDRLDLELHSACGADLMSDVLAFVKEDAVLLTGLVNAQTLRTASLMDMPVIVFVRGKVPPPNLVAEAQASGLVLLTTRLTLFLACGRLYEAGLRQGAGP